MRGDGLANSRWWYILRGGFALGLITLLSWALHLPPASASHLFLIAIVVNALDSDLLSAAILSLGAVACLDYFLTPPLYSFGVANPADWITFATFLFTAFVVTRLGDAARRREREARAASHRATQLAGLTERLLNAEPASSAQESILTALRETLGLTCVSLFDGASAEAKSRGHSEHDLPRLTKDAFIHGRDLDLPGPGIAIRCLRRAGRAIAAIGYEGLREPSLMAGPLTAAADSCLKRLEAADAAAKAASQAESEALRAAILDGLAHEFKTPLTTVLTAAGGLRELGPLSSDQEELVDLVESETARLGNLTSRLLGIAQLDRKQLNLQPVPFDLVALARRVTLRHSEFWPEHRFRLVDSEHPIRVNADPELIQLALNQLVDNACKYSQPGSVVELRFSSSLEMGSISVWSPSEAIDLPDRPLLFDRFFRAHQHNPTAGSGLGLYIARKVVSAHGGRLILEPEDRHRPGTAFELSLPFPATGVSPP